MTRRAIGAWLAVAAFQCRAQEHRIYNAQPIDLMPTVSGTGVGYRIHPANDSDDWGQIDFRFRVADGYEAYRSKHEADRTGDEWVKQIFRLPGVEQMEVRQHMIRIRKADGFEWAAILEPAAEIVCREKGWTHGR